ncbi:MAG TPA: GAF domain-containing sensor histidine kinase [Thermoanaerobaculia bacterium]
MTLKRLRAISILIPIAGVIALEAARYAIVGAVSWEQRILLDLIYIGAIVVFAAVIFRYIGAMQKRLERQNEELLALHGAGLDVTADLSLDVVLRKVVEQARSLVGAKYGAVSVVDKDNRIVSFITSGITPEERAAIGPPPVGHGLLGVTLREGHRLRLEDLTRHPQSQGFPPHHPPMHSLLAVPIPCKGPFLGNLYLTEKEATGIFTADDEETLVRFALQAALAIDNAHLHEQVADLAVAQERLRIAHEMHDGLAQVLGYVNTKVQAAEMYLKREKTEEAAAQLRELATSARQAYSDVRESIVGLRTLPGPSRSLTEVLGEYLDRWEEMSNVETSLRIDPAVQLRPSQELQVVRIVQESLTNVRKHARASHASVEITRDGDKLVAVIADDGAGFNAAARARGEFPQFGLSTMRERAESIGGTLTIDSAPGQGTRVRFELPVGE